LSVACSLHSGRVPLVANDSPRWRLGGSTRFLHHCGWPQNVQESQDDPGAWPTPMPMIRYFC